MKINETFEIGFETRVERWTSILRREAHLAEGALGACSAEEGAVTERAKCAAGLPALWVSLGALAAAAARRPRALRRLNHRADGALRHRRQRSHRLGPVDPKPFRRNRNYSSTQALRICWACYASTAASAVG